MQLELDHDSDALESFEHVPFDWYHGAEPSAPGCLDHDRYSIICREPSVCRVLMHVFHTFHILSSAIICIHTCVNVRYMFFALYYVHDFYVAV